MLSSLLRKITNIFNFQAHQHRLSKMIIVTNIWNLQVGPDVATPVDKLLISHNGFVSTFNNLCYKISNGNIRQSTKNRKLVSRRNRAMNQSHCITSSSLMHHHHQTCKETKTKRNQQVEKQFITKEKSLFS